MNSIFHRLKKLKKSEFNFSCKVITLTTHEFHFFCMVEQLTQHSIQLFANWKRCKNNFCFHEKWIHYIGGKRFALVRALWARPHMMNPFFMKKITFEAFSFRKTLDWRLCNIFNQGKMSFVCERCVFIRKIQFMFFELF